MGQIALLAHLDDKRCVLRAAEAVGMTQPAASKSLRDIENALQVQLFNRHARGIVPTSSGEILVRHARSILSEINLAQEELATLKSGLSGQASVGTITAPAATLPQLTGHPARRAPPRTVCWISKGCLQCQSRVGRFRPRHVLNHCVAFLHSGHYNEQPCEEVLPRETITQNGMLWTSVRTLSLCSAEPI